MGNRALSFAPLVALQVRRLCLGFPGLLFLITLVLLRLSWSAPEGYGGLQDAPLVRLSAALQQGVWLWVLWCALQLGLRVRSLCKKEANWLAPLGIGQGAYLLAIWFGTCLASGLAIALLFTSLLVGGTAHAPVHSIDRVGAWKADAALQPGQALQQTIHAGRSSLLAIHVRPTVGAAPTTQASLTVSRGLAGKQIETRIDGLTWMLVAIPDGSEALNITLANTDDGVLGVLGSHGLLTLSKQGPFTHWMRLGLLAWFWTGLTLALVLTACTWLRPAIAIPMAFLVAIGIGAIWPGWLAAWPGALRWQSISMGTQPFPMLPGLLALPLLAACWLLARRGLHAWGIDR